MAIPKFLHQQIPIPLSGFRLKFKVWATKTKDPALDGTLEIRFWCRRQKFLRRPDGSEHQYHDLISPPLSSSLPFPTSILAHPLECKTLISYELARVLILREDLYREPCQFLASKIVNFAREFIGRGHSGVHLVAEVELLDRVKYDEGMVGRIYGNVDNFIGMDIIAECLAWWKTVRRMKQQKSFNPNEIHCMNKNKCIVTSNLSQLVIKLPCGHLFHRSCAYSFVVKKKICPLCHSKISMTKCRLALRQNSYLKPLYNNKLKIFKFK
ncbi:hypothetical protein SLE2022_328590 [Rubroshorea leprosula]